MARASSGLGKSEDPRRSSTRILLPAPFMRAMGRPASEWRKLNPSVSLPARAAASRRAAWSIARAPRRVKAARKASSSIEARPHSLRPRRRRSGPARPRRSCLNGGKRTLPERDLFDAAPAEMRIDPGDDDRRIVLGLERECAVDPAAPASRARSAPPDRASSRAAAIAVESAARNARSIRRRSPASPQRGSPR